MTVLGNPSTQAQTEPPRPDSAKGILSGATSIRDFSLAIALVAIWVFFARQNSAFLGAINLSNLAIEVSMTAVLALGMLLIIVAGHIDLSVGSGVGLFGALTAVLISEHGWPAPAAMGVSALGAVLVWLFMACPVLGQRSRWPMAVVGGLLAAGAFYFVFGYHLHPELAATSTGLLKMAPWALPVGVAVAVFMILIRSGQTVPAFIMTLAGMFIFKGLHWLIIRDAAVSIRWQDQPNLCSMLISWYLPAMAGYLLVGGIVVVTGLATIVSRRRRRKYGVAVETAELAFAKWFIAGQLLLLFLLVCNQYQGIPFTAVILAAAALLVWVLSQHTRFGRYIYAIGGNEEAALLSGVPVKLVTLGAFGIMGLLVALDGFLQTAYQGFSTTTVGQGLELDAIAACIIGGTSVKGGRGTVLGVLFGALLMASLLNGMTLMNVNPEQKFIARGVVLALAVWLDVRLGRSE